MPVRPQEFDLASLPAPAARPPAPRPLPTPRPGLVGPRAAPSVPVPAVPSAPPAPPPARQVVVPGYTLFSVRAIFWSTLVGSPLAGSILVGINYRKLGKGKETAPSILVGLLVTIAHLITFYESRLAAIVVAAVFWVAMGLIGKALLGTAVLEHKGRGGRLASGGVAFLISLLCQIVILAAIASIFPHLSVNK